MGSSLKFTLSRILAACEAFGMSNDEQLKFFKLLLTSRGAVGRPRKIRLSEEDLKRERDTYRKGLEELLGILKEGQGKSKK
jgi:hypothetical protein